jgi:prophage regulatory protein
VISLVFEIQTETRSTQMQQHKIDRFLREPQVFNVTKLSRSTRWRLEKEGKFPRRRRISCAAVGWLESEILFWLESCTVIGGAE